MGGVGEGEGIELGLVGKMKSKFLINIKINK